MNNPNTIDGTPVMTSMKYRTRLANQDCLPYSVRYRATPIPIGTEISVASATISRVPRMALRTPPGLPKNSPFGSVVKKLLLHELRPL